MKNRTAFERCALAAACLAVVASVPAMAQQPMLEWATPTTPTNKPQTHEQAKEGMEHGRALPPPEVLQPTLDRELPAYTPRNEKLAGHFKGAASDVMVVLAKKWVDAFRKYYPDVTFTIDPPYAGSLGAVELVKGDLDFVFVSRELKPSDVTGFEAKYGYAPLSVPISGGSYRHFGALDAVAFMVNKANPIDGLSFEQLDALFSKTRLRGGKEIRTWGDLGAKGDWAAKPIHLYGIKPWNGFEEFVRQRVLSTPGHRGEWRDDISFEKVVFPMAKHVAEDPYGIGYTGVAYLDAPVKVIAVQEDGSKPFEPATYEAVALAKYPLSRLTYFNTNKAPGKPLDPTLEEFLKFVLSREGQQVVLDQAAYIPLRARQATAARALLQP